MDGFNYRSDGAHFNIHIIFGRWGLGGAARNEHFVRPGGRQTIDLCVLRVISPVSQLRCRRFQWFFVPRSPHINMWKVRGRSTSPNGISVLHLAVYENLASRFKFRCAKEILCTTENSQSMACFALLANPKCLYFYLLSVFASTLLAKLFFFQHDI